MVNEYTTAAYVQAELRADTAFSSSTTPTLSQLTNWIQEESKIIELRTGQIFGSTVVSSEYFDYDGSGMFRFPVAPILSIEKVEYNMYGNALTPSWIELTGGFGEDYLEYLSEGEIMFIGTKPTSGDKKLRISYTYGDTSTPLEIQRLATLSVAKRVTMSLINSQSNTEGGSISVGTISITDPSNFSANWFKSVNSEIDDIYSKIGNNLRVFRVTRNY